MSEWQETNATWEQLWKDLGQPGKLDSKKDWEALHDIVENAGFVDPTKAGKTNQGYLPSADALETIKGNYYPGSWKEELNKLYQEYFGRDVDESGLYTYGKGKWRGNIPAMRKELAKSGEHKAYRQTDEFKEREAKRRADEHRRSITYAKDYWTDQAKDSRVTLPDGTTTTVGGGIDVKGKGFDLSPHNSALRTWYMQERIDQKLDDEVYGTQQLRQIFDNVEDAFLDEVYDNEAGETIVSGDVQAHWGLDLRRVGLDAEFDPGRGLIGLVENIMSGAGPEGNAIQNNDYYETLTKGEVNWAAYKDDKKYQAAFKEMQQRAINDDDPNTIADDWDITKLGSEHGHTERYVSQIRQVNRETPVLKTLMKSDSDGWKFNWDGKYDPDKIIYDETTGDLFIDGNRQTTYAEMISSGDADLINPKDYVGEDGRTPLGALNVKTQIAQVIKPDIQSNQVSVTRPPNIPKTWDVGEGKKSLRIEKSTSGPSGGILASGASTGALPSGGGGGIFGFLFNKTSGGKK